MKDDDLVELLKILSQIEEAKQDVYLQMADRTNRDELRKLLGSLADAKGNHAQIFSLVPETGIRQSAMRKHHIADLQRRASSLLGTLTTKKEKVPDITPRLLVMESVYRTEEESVRVHKSVREQLSGTAGMCFDVVVMEEERDLATLRQKVLVAVFGMPPD